MHVVILGLLVGCAQPEPEAPPPRPDPPQTTPTVPEPTTPPPVCGDGRVDPGEACDEGALNATEGATCTAECGALELAPIATSRPLDPVDEAVQRPIDVHHGDFDGDGTRDVLVEADNLFDNALTLQALNDGTGTLWTPRRSTQGRSMTALGLADLTGDTVLDVVGLSGQGFLGQRTWPGDPEGIAPALIWTIDRGGLAMVLRDLSGDGVVDAAVLDGDGDVALLAGTGKGALDPGLVLPVDRSDTVEYTELLLADVTGDGIDDLVVLSTGGDATVAVCEGDRVTQADLEMFDKCLSQDSLGLEGSSAGPLDFDGDGDLEIVGRVPDKDGWSVFDWVSGKLERVESLVLQDGGQVCDDAVLLAPAIGDLDGDGKSEAVVACDVGPFVVSSGPSPTVRRLPCAACTEPGRTATIGDADGDGDADVITLSLDGEVAIWWGDGSATPPGPADVRRYGDRFAGWIQLAVGEVTADGVPDLVLADKNGPVVLRGLGGRRFLNPTQGTSLGHRPTAVLDANGDGFDDYVKVGAVADQRTLDLFLHDRGGQRFVSVDLQPVLPAIFGAPHVPRDIAAGRLDGDDDDDMVMLVDGHYVVLLSDGEGGIEAASAVTTVSETFRQVELSDLDGDGQLDLLGLDPASGLIEARRGNGDATFGNPRFVESGAALAALVAADIDGDGLLDLVDAREATGVLELRRATEPLGWADPVPLGLRSFADPTALAAGDANGDGRVDLVLTTIDDRAWILLGFGNGAFAQPIEQRVGDEPSAVLLTDLDGDELDEVVTANAGGTGLTVLFGERPAGP